MTVQFKFIHYIISMLSDCINQKLPILNINYQINRHCMSLVRNHSFFLLQMQFFSQKRQCAQKEDKHRNGKTETTLNLKPKNQGPFNKPPLSSTI